jgi:hypothetical protein
MSVAFTMSNASLARVYAASFQGRIARACLAVNPGTLNENSTTAQWDAAEITSQAANGYTRFTWTIPAGTYDPVLALFRGAATAVSFQANTSGTGLTYDTVYVVTGTGNTWDTNVEMILLDPQALPAGAPIAYNVSFLADNITSAPSGL